MISDFYDLQVWIKNKVHYHEVHYHNGLWNWDIWTIYWLVQVYYLLSNFNKKWIDIIQFFNYKRFTRMCPYKITPLHL